MICNFITSVLLKFYHKINAFIVSKGFTVKELGWYEIIDWRNVLCKRSHPKKDGHCAFAFRECEAHILFGI